MENYQEVAQDSQRDKPSAAKKGKKNKIQPGPIEDQFENEMDNIINETAKQKRHQYKASIASMGNEVGITNQESATTEAKKKRNDLSQNTTMQDKMKNTEYATERSNPSV